MLTSSTQFDTPTVDLTAPVTITGDTQFENNLRPVTLAEYIGQEDIKSNLSIAIQSSKIRGETLDHILLYGPPGLGKTTLANIISKEIGSQLRITSGPALEKQGDLVAILSNLESGDVLFIDEIHRLKPQIEEVLYTAMEDFCVDIVIGKGPSARSMRITLPRFTLIGATTKVSMLSNPLYDRFGNIYKLAFYSQDEISIILMRSAQILGISISKQASKRIACASRATPRIANRLLKRVRDYSVTKMVTDIDLDTVELVLQMLKIDAKGLDNNDRQLLQVIVEKFRGGPVGLSTLSAAIADDASTIEDMYEPYLLQLGLLERTPKGRMITDMGRSYIGLTTVSDSQSLPF